MWVIVHVPNGVPAGLTAVSRVFVPAQRVPGCVAVEGEDRQEEPSGRRIVETARIGRLLRSGHARRPVDLDGVAEEVVERLERLASTGGRVDRHSVVDRLEDVPAAHTEPLVGRLRRPLVATGEQPLLPMVDAAEAHGTHRRRDGGRRRADAR